MVEFKRENFIKMKSFEGITFLGLRHDFFDVEEPKEEEEVIDEPEPEPVKEEPRVKEELIEPPIEDIPKPDPKADKIAKLKAALAELEGE